LNTSPLSSILEQTFDDFEFLIVDDGSTDVAMVERLKHWEGTDPRIRILRRSHEGLTASLNALIENAKGQYLARMDADDISMRNRLECEVEFMERNPDTQLVSSWFDLIDESGEVFKSIRTVIDHARIVRAWRLMSNPIAHAATMLRSRTLRDLGGFDERFGISGGAEDYELWTRILTAGKVAIIPEVLLQHRFTPLGASHMNAVLHCRSYWLGWKVWILRQNGVKAPYERAMQLYKRWRIYYDRRFKAEALRYQAGRIRLIGKRQEARVLLAKAVLVAPWNVMYPLLWLATFIRR